MPQTTLTEKELKKLNVGRAQTQRPLFHWAGWVALGTLSSRVLGYIRDALMAALFPRVVTDAWFIAFRIPNLVRRLFGEGALANGFTPVYLDLQKSDLGSATHLARKTFVATTILTGLAATIFGVWVQPILLFLAPGTGFVGELSLAVTFAQSMAAYMVLSSWYAFSSALLNAHFKFRAAAFAPTLWNVGMIFCAAYAGRQGEVAYAWLGYGVLLGGVLQVACVVQGFRLLGPFHRGQSKRPVPDLPQEKAGTVLARLLPTWIGLSANQFMILINTYFASQMIVGSNSWLYWADRLFELPIALFSTSLSTVLLPYLSAADRSDHQRLWKETATAFLWVGIPCTVGLLALAHPIIQVLFQRGEFKIQDTEFTAQVLRTFAIAIPSAGLARLMLTRYFSDHRVWYPAACALAAAVIHFGMMKLNLWGQDIVGLARSATITSYLLLLMLKFGQPQGPKTMTKSRFLKSYLQLIGSIVVMASFLVISETALAGYDSLGVLLVRIFLGGGISVILFFIAGSALGARVPRQLLTFCRRQMMTEV